MSNQILLKPIEERSLNTTDKIKHKLFFEKLYIFAIKKVNKK